MSLQHLQWQLDNPNKRHLMILAVGLCLALTTVLNTPPAQAANQPTNKQQAPQTAKNKPDYEDAYLRLRLVRRSPKQIAAFYEGRQFPKAAVDKLDNVCFIAAIIRNKTKDILWLDLSTWRFENGKPIQRYLREYWKQQWQQAKVDKASQATFGWTLLPEQRDLRPDESVGGNITLPPMQSPFSIIAVFDRGAKRNLTPVTVRLDNVTCKQDEKQ